MTTPSKRRRAARAWMSEERTRSELRARLAATVAAERKDREWRERLTLIVPPDSDDTFYPQGRLKQPYVVVAAPPRDCVRDFGAPISPMGITERPVMMVAKQAAIVLPNGAKFVWWTWEIGR